MRLSLKKRLVATLVACLATTISAQVSPAPIQTESATPSTEPTTPPAQLFRDTHSEVSFRIPDGWNLSRKDSDLSTFSLDARTAPATTQMRAVAGLTFNPFPNSTFTGALFYFSITPHATEAECIRQASAQAPRSVATTQIGGLPFTHGYDEHGGICIESRDEIYTAQRKNACYRFDLVINTFCGGDAGAGARDVTPRELEAISNRMQIILDSVRFDQK